ncbi:MAG: rhodanese-related sulfurtransferase [Pelagibacteraceae bacterium]|nr:rhodanese-related sulfurtransferase [Pelagibacteraceae bacterium]PHX88994.1 MAG: hypothetical protein CK535_04100 [Pelagibacteraceae bacterium]
MVVVVGFYKFKKVNFLKKKKELINDLLIKNNIRGTIIISQEGINGSISGKLKDIKNALKALKTIFIFSTFDSSNISKILFQPFHRLKVKIKKELVPMNISLSTHTKKKSSYIEPEKWNSLIKDENTLLIDARKPFEHALGTFKNSINPHVNNFRDFPKFLNKLNKNRPIAMFCTGGIRCEKSSVYLEKKGFKNIYQLKGGILNYLNKINSKISLWKGECFVFDNRISVKHGLKVGTYSICSGCREPVSSKDKKSKKYEEGVSCIKCYDKLTQDQKERFRMRQKQIKLAKESGKKHIFQKEFS